MAVVAQKLPQASVSLLGILPCDFKSLKKRGDLKYQLIDLSFVMKFSDECISSFGLWTAQSWSCFCLCMNYRKYLLKRFSVCGGVHRVEDQQVMISHVLQQVSAAAGAQAQPASGLGCLCLWEMAEGKAGPRELLLQLIPARWGEYSLLGRCESCLSRCLPGFMLPLQSSAGSGQRAGGFQPYPGMELSPCSFLHPHLTCVLSSFKITRKLSSCISPFCIFSHPSWTSGIF